MRATNYLLESGSFMDSARPTTIAFPYGCRLLFARMLRERDDCLRSGEMTGVNGTELLAWNDATFTNWMGFLPRHVPGEFLDG